MNQDRIDEINIFRGILGHKPGDIVSIQALDGTTKGGVRYHKYVTTTAEMIPFIEKHENILQIYIMINTVKPDTDLSKWPTEDNIQYTNIIYLDCDCDKNDPVITDDKEIKYYAATKDEYETVWPAIDKIKAWLTDHGFKNGYHDKTGNGIRFILPIPAYDVSDPIIRKEWKNKIRLFYDEIEDDLKIKLDSVQDIRRITGIPGTPNVKKETETRKNRIREPGNVTERIEDKALLDHILSLSLDSTQAREIDKLKQKKVTDETPIIKNTTTVHYSVVLNDLIKTDPEFLRMYSGDLKEGETDRSDIEMIVVNKLIKKGYHYNKNSLNFKEIDAIMNKCKIGKWADENRHYKQVTYNSGLDFCEPQETNENVTRSYNMNDTGNSYRMYDLHGEDLRYCYGSNEWFIWKGKIWVIDKTGAIQEFASSTVDSIYKEAESMEDSDFKKKMLKYASSCGQLPKLNNMSKRLQSIGNIPVLMEDFDLNDWILPVQNGTIELKTCELRESKRIDMCSKIANVFYDPAAKCPEFMEFYEQIQPNQDTRRYLQKVLGYSLTGDTSEEQVFFNLGNGWNGKNTLMDIIVYILGDFAINIDSKTILTSDTQTSTTDYEVARMKGARLVTASEPEAGKTLNDAQIKKVTNSKALITARRLYQEPFDYYPTHKLFFSANQRPYVKDNTNGTWRRIRIIPFNVKITEDSRDAGLPDRLRAEASGILNWLLEGCKLWQNEGLKMCAEVELATAEYKADMDIVTEFLNEYTIKGDNENTISNTMLRDQYNEWALIRGYKKLTPQTFSSKMRERGHEGTIYKGSRVWHNLILKDIKERTSGGLVVDLKGMETLSGGLGGLNSKSLENKKNNNGNGSCDKDTKNNIENLSFPESPPSPLDSVLALDKSTTSPFVNRLTPYDKNMIIEDMKKHYEGKTGESLTTENLNQYAVFVHKKYDAYSIYDIMVDVKNKYNLEVTA